MLVTVGASRVKMGVFFVKTNMYRDLAGP